MKKALTPKERKEKLGIALGGMIGFAIASLLVSYFTGRFDSDEKKIQKMVVEMNAELPMTVDDYTQLDSMSADGKTLNYFYTCIYLDKEDADYESINKNMAPAILNNLKTNPTTEILRKMNITFIHSYNDKNGALFYSYKITPDMYL